MILNLLPNFQIDKERSIIIPLEINGIQINHIALNFDFALTSGSWKDLKSSIVFRRSWFYEGKSVYEFYSEVTPNVNSVIFPLEDFSHFNENSSYCSLLISKTFRYPGVVENVTYSTTLDLIYNERNYS